MRRYPTYSNRKRGKRNKKVIGLVLLITLFFGIKLYMNRQAPAPTFAIEEQVNLPLPQLPEPVQESPPVAEMKPEEGKSQPFELPQLPETTSKENRRLKELLRQVETSLDGKSEDIIEARNRLNEMLTLPMSNKQQTYIKKQMSLLSNQWLFSRQVYPSDTLCELYEVQLGDIFSNIAKKCKVPHEILMRINNISDPRQLRAGETIKIINGPFHCRISRSTFTMDVYLHDTFVRSFVVGLGRPAMETPKGRWLVKSDGKLIQPTWTHPETGKTYQSHDPDYPLGARWIGLEGLEGEAKGRTGFAIHGTKNPEEIGRDVSRGCIRLYNQDVVLIYDLLMPGVSQVIIED